MKYVSFMCYIRLSLPYGHPRKNETTPKMIERCKEDEHLRVVVFSYAFHSLLVPLMMGLQDAKEISETDSSNE